MNRALKWIGIVIGVCIIVVVAALLIIPQFIDVQKYKPLLQSQVTEFTGRPFSIGDDLRLSLFPWIGVSFSDLSLGNAKGFAEKEFVAVKSFDVSVKLLPLLSKDIQIKRFVVHEPDIVLVKNKDGSVNWAFPKAAETKAETKKEPAGGMNLPIKALTVGDFAIENGTVLWIDHTNGTRKEVTGVNLTLGDVSLEKPIKLDLSAQMDNKPLAVSGTVGPVGKTIGQQPVALDLTVEALNELKLLLKGSVENPMADPTVKLAVALADFSPRRLMEALGTALPVQTADPKALSRVALSADVTASAKAVAISKGALALDDSKLNFDMQASDFARPNLSFDLNLDQIDLDRYLPPKTEEKAAAEKDAASQPAEKPDYAPLRKMILNGSLKIGKLTVNKAKLSELLLQIRAKDGVINLDPIKTALYDGGFQGKGVVDVRTDTPTTKFSADMKGVRVNPLLQDVLEKDILEGTTQAHINLSMAGDNAAAIKRTLNGSGQLTFLDGAIKGFDLAAMVRNTTAAFGLEQKSAERPKTDFAELSVPFTITNGLFNTPDTAMKSPFLRLDAKGDAHLVEETLDFRVDPKVVATMKGQGDDQQRSGLLVPVLISGTFAKPQFRPDLEALAQQHLNVDKKELEAKAKEALDAKTTEMLGGQSGVAKDILGQGQTTDRQQSGAEKPEDKAKGLIKGILKGN